jgi:hypothetical protein
MSNNKGACSGCGCGAILTVLLLVYVIAAPAESFPLWGKILAYMFEGAIVVGVLWAWGSGRVAWSNGRFETRTNIKDSGQRVTNRAAGVQNAGATETKFKMANYDGGLPWHPTPEKDGTLVLKPDLWELHYVGTGEWAYGGIARLPLEATSTGFASCHVTIRDTQDPTIIAAFDLPHTPVDMLRAALGTSRAAPSGESVTTGLAPRNADGEKDAMAQPNQESLPLINQDPTLRPSLSQPPRAPPSPPASILDEIKKLAELRDSGILTEAEFQAKKVELLARM